MERTQAAAKALAVFNRQWGTGNRPVITVVAPCRLTLLGGEYTEAVDGLSLLAAGEDFLAVAAQRRSDRALSVYSQNYDEKMKFSLGGLQFERSDGWANYPKGVVYYYERTGRKLEGLQLSIVSGIAEHEGLGSSAALCAACATAANTLGAPPLDVPTLVKLCERVERQFLQRRSDFFSPFVVQVAKENHLVFFDPRSFKAEYLEWNNEKYRFVVVDSGIRGKDREKEYQKRLDLFQKLLPEVRKVVPKVLSWRDVGREAFSEVKRHFDILDRKRLEHVILENERVQRAQALLSSGKVESLGELMEESQLSQMEKLRISTPELDLLFETMRRAPGYRGARLMGIGFGGALVGVVQTAKTEDFSEFVKKEYFRQVNIHPKVHVYRACAGTQVVEMAKEAPGR